MLEVRMTPNLLGFQISGDYDTLSDLYDAIWALTPPDEDFPDSVRNDGSTWSETEHAAGSRLLALCYDLRHAYQGDRHLEVRPTGMTQEEADWHKVPLVDKSLVYSVEVLYPEAMYECSLISAFSAKRQRGLGNAEPYSARRGPASPGACIALARYYQSLVLEAVSREATPGRFSRIADYLSEGQLGSLVLYPQWIDVINADYTKWTRKRGAGSLSTIVRDIVEWHKVDQCLGMMADIDHYAKEHGCRPSDVRLSCTSAYDQDFVW